MADTCRAIVLNRSPLVRTRVAAPADCRRYRHLCRQLHGQLHCIFIADFAANLSPA